MRRWASDSRKVENVVGNYDSGDHTRSVARGLAKFPSGARGRGCALLLPSLRMLGAVRLSSKETILPPSEQRALVVFGKINAFFSFHQQNFARAIHDADLSSHDVPQAESPSTFFNRNIIATGCLWGT